MTHINFIVNVDKLTSNHSWRTQNYIMKSKLMYNEILYYQLPFFMVICVLPIYLIKIGKQKKYFNIKYIQVEDFDKS